MGTALPGLDPAARLDTDPSDHPHDSPQPFDESRTSHPPTSFPEMIRAFLIIYTLLAALVLAFYALSDRPGWLEPRMQYVSYRQIGPLLDEGWWTNYLGQALDLPERGDAAQIQRRLEAIGIQFPHDAAVHPFYASNKPPEGFLDLEMWNSPANHERLLHEILKNQPAELPEEAPLYASGS